MKKTRIRRINKSFLTYILTVIAGPCILYAQNIELPEITTVITEGNETEIAETQALPDFSDILKTSEKKYSKSGDVVPQLPELNTAKGDEENETSDEVQKKSVYAQGVIGCGYPALFEGNFSVFRTVGDNPFKFSFDHNSAAGYSGHQLTQCYSDKATELTVEKSFKNKKFDWGFFGTYKSVSDGLQNHSEFITALNHNIYGAKADFSYRFGNGFSTGLLANLNAFNRYSDVVKNASSVDVPSVAYVGLSPKAFVQWKNYGFTVGFDAEYTFGKPINGISDKNLINRGQFKINFAWEKQYIKTYADASAVVGNKIGKNSVVVPFTVGIDSSFPVYFANRRFYISAEGGIDSKLPKFYDFEDKYKFAVLDYIPSETSNWYGRFSVSVPVKSSFTGSALIEYRQTAFGNKTDAPDYSVLNGFLYSYKSNEKKQLISDFTIAYNFGKFSISGEWRSNWIDVPALEYTQIVSLGFHLKDDNSRWGADLSGYVPFDDTVFSPIVNFEGFLRLTPAVRAVLSVNDIVKLVQGSPRVYSSSDYITRGGNATLLLKFIF